MKDRLTEDNRHLWVVYPLLGLAGLAAIVAALLPLAQWAFSAAGFVTILMAFLLLKEVGLLRGKARVIVPILFYVGLYAVHGFAGEFIRQNIPPALTQPINDHRRP